ncbi:MAG: hypothetical protein QOJ26_472 [Thermoplasmata archaeon]|nr:hypothetical protein [Thermoplasmata archaeon]MEA3165606.1 hypothetical protein [Thermoplasmata archaeon]
MMTPRSLTVAGLVALLCLVATPNAIAEPSADAAAVQVLDCRTYAWDSDGDGHAENWQTCSTPQCGCMCPVVGGVIQLEAAGSEQNVAAFGSCQSGYGTSSESSDGSVGVRVTPRLYGGGVIAPVEGSGLDVTPLPELPVGVSTAVQVLDCRNYSWDYDHDGQAENWQTCSTPQCGCMCPVVGGIVQLEALGQEHNVLGFASCQSGYGTSTEAESDGSVGVRVTPVAGGGGLDGILA